VRKRETPGKRERNRVRGGRERWEKGRETRRKDQPARVEMTAARLLPSPIAVM
jgi:hypothetical protein